MKDPTDLVRLVHPNVEKDLKYVGDAITLTRHKLEGKVPLIGFTGAPVSKSIPTYYKASTFSIYICKLLVDINELHDPRWR